MKSVSRCPKCLSYFNKSQPMRRKHQRAQMSFVPAHKATEAKDISLLQDFIDKARRLFVLTGAGLSTESGIPDYRSEGVGLYARSTRRPMQYQEFVKSEKSRQRYWARNFVGWPKFSSTEPNIAHHTITDWWRKGKVSTIVTQNVDALHTKSGAIDTIELHGCSHRVKCLACNRMSSRQDLQTRFEDINPDMKVVDMPIAPDGDVLLQEDQVKGFKVPHCESCNGPLIPDVVFFGDNVPRPRVEQVYHLLEKSDSFLVAGSSLQVYSGYRFVKRAAENNIPIVIVNVGETRGDELTQLKIESLCGTVLPKVEVKPL